MARGRSKISHVDSEVVDEILNKLDERCGKEAPMVTTRGNIHDYLGMTLDCNINGKVQITMFEYIAKIIEEFRMELDGEPTSPAINHLFEVDDNGVKLKPEQKDLFHEFVAKLLFLGKQSRPDLKTAISFLSTRVREPDTDNYKKIISLMKYLKGTKDIPLTLEADNSGCIKWWVDASFPVHPDMKSHSGTMMSMVQRAEISGSKKQKVNTKSSTESELVGVDDYMPMIIWVKYFLEAHGYIVSNNLLHQDNQSSVKLEQNGKANSVKRTRHIAIRYYLVTVRIAGGDLRVDSCTTEKMLADFCTKPLQEKLFRMLRSMIMNIQKTDSKDISNIQLHMTQ